MNALLLSLALISNLISSSLARPAYCKKYAAKNSDLYIFNTFSSFVSLLTLLLIAGIGGKLTFPSTYTVTFAFLFGLVTALGALFSIKAIEIGSLSYTTVIVCCSLIIPSLSGVFLYHESITIWQGIGVILMLVSIICSVERSNSKGGSSLRWLLFWMAAFIAVGAVGVLQKVYQKSIYAGEMDLFLIIAFAVSTLFSLMLALCYSRKEHVRPFQVANKKSLALLSFVNGVGLAFENLLCLYLAGAMDAIIFFPIVNGGTMLLAAFAGYIVWKERFSLLQWIGMLCGGGAILLLCSC